MLSAPHVQHVLGLNPQVWLNKALPASPTHHTCLSWTGLLANQFLGVTTVATHALLRPKPLCMKCMKHIDTVKQMQVTLLSAGSNRYGACLPYNTVWTGEAVDIM